MLAGLINWAERRASRLGQRGPMIDGVLAALWGMIGAPIIWIIVTPLFGGQGSDAILYALGIAVALSVAGCAVTARLVRRWRR